MRQSNPIRQSESDFRSASPLGCTIHKAFKERERGIGREREHRRTIHPLSLSVSLYPSFFLSGRAVSRRRSARSTSHRTGRRFDRRGGGALPSNQRHTPASFSCWREVTGSAASFIAILFGCSIHCERRCRRLESTRGPASYVALQRQTLRKTWCQTSGFRPAVILK